MTLSKNTITISIWHLQEKCSSLSQRLLTFLGFSPMAANSIFKVHQNTCATLYRRVNRGTAMVRETGHVQRRPFYSHVVYIFHSFHGGASFFAFYLFPLATFLHFFTQFHPSPFEFFFTYSTAFSASFLLYADRCRLPLNMLIYFQDHFHL